jgi:hypothetical protein
MEQTQYPNNFGSYNVQPQGGYPPPPPPYAAPPVQGYPAVQPGMPGVIMQQPTQGNGSAVASLVIGIISMIAWLLPIIGVPLSIVGIVLANRGRRLFSQRGMATAGLVLCIIALGLALLNAVAGVLLALH